MSNPHPRTDHLKPHQWKPGQSGNPNGRPSNLSKTFVRLLEMNKNGELDNMTEKEKREFVKSLPPIIRWMIARGSL